MNQISTDSLHIIALLLRLQDIYNFSLTNKRFRADILDNEIFWKLKFFQDFKFLLNDQRTWKLKYQQHGNVLACGENLYGELGIGHNRMTKIITSIPKIKVKQISIRENHSIILDINNNVWVTGNNEHGKLGLNGEYFRSNFIQLTRFKAQQVSCGNNHTLLLDLDNNIWSFGSYYQVGRKYPSYIPYKIYNVKAKQISAGDTHSLFIDMEDHVWAFGDNSYGQCGLDEDTFFPRQVFKDEDLTPLKAQQICAGYNNSVIIDLNNNVWVFGENYENHPELLFNVKCQYVSSGKNYMLLIDLENNLWRSVCFTDYPEQILGVKAQQISCGYSHSGFIDMENRIWSFGENNYGQLGIGTTSISEDIKMIPNIQAQQIVAGNKNTLIIQY